MFTRKSSFIKLLYRIYYFARRINIFFTILYSAEKESSKCCYHITDNSSISLYLFYLGCGNFLYLNQGHRMLHISRQASTRPYCLELYLYMYAHNPTTSVGFHISFYAFSYTTSSGSLFDQSATNSVNQTWTKISVDIPYYQRFLVVCYIYFCT